MASNGVDEAPADASAEESFKRYVEPVRSRFFPRVFPKSPSRPRRMNGAVRQSTRGASIET